TAAPAVRRLPLRDALPIGVELATSDSVGAGAPIPAGPAELVALIDTILRGAFTGDFAVALDRAAAFCRVQASGSTHLAERGRARSAEHTPELPSRENLRCR